MNPAIATAASIAPGVVPNIIDLFFMELASNKIFNALIMITMNIGGKYLAMELPSKIDKLFQTHQGLRYMVIFAICFMATRDIKYAIFMALIVIIVFRFLLNETSNYCVIQKEYFENLDQKNTPQPVQTNIQTMQPQSPTGLISEEEFMKARDMVETYARQRRGIH
jgi:hypothetical protein